MMLNIKCLQLPSHLNQVCDLYTSFTIFVYIIFLVKKVLCILYKILITFQLLNYKIIIFFIVVKTVKLICCRLQNIRLFSLLEQLLFLDCVSERGGNFFIKGNERKRMRRGEECSLSTSLTHFKRR